MAPSLAARYGAAIVATAVAVLIRFAVEPLVGAGQVPYFTLFFTIVLLGWYAGIGPALLATVLGGLATLYFVLPPRFSLALTEPYVGAGVVVYLVTSVASALLGEAMRRARLGAEAQESRLALMSDIGELTRTIEDPRALLFAVATAVGEHFRVSRCLFNEIDLEHDREVVYQDYCRGVESVAGVHRITDYSSVTSSEMAAGKIVINEDSKTDSRTAAAYEKTYAPAKERAYVAVPLMRDRRWVASLWVSDDVPRRWTDQEVSLLELIASRVWAVVEKLRVDAALRQSEERYRSLTRVLTSIVWQTDAAGEFVSEQPEWAAFTGQTWEQYRGWGWAEAIHPDDREAVGQRWKRAVAANAMYTSHGRIWHAPSGEYRYFSAQAVPLLDDDRAVREWIGTVTDVHEQRKAEESLRHADRMKDEFLATLSHELRTPLTAIVGWSQMLEMLDLSERDQQLALETIRNSAKAQLQLIEDVLDVSRITTGKMRLERRPAALSTIVEDALATVRPAAEAKQIPISVSLDRTLGLHYVDPSRLQQVVWNLLSNAIKFSPPGTPVRVALRREDGSAVIEVADDGPGIAPEFLPHLFARFRQADSSATRAHAGLGLGLALAKELTELHGGTIAVESEPGRGSRFTVRLPMPAMPMTSEHTTPPDTDRTRAPLHGLRVLYVDDREDARLLIRTMLRKSGADVANASSVDEALALLGDFKPDVVVTDIAMPDRDGYDLLAAIRNDGTWSNLPVVALTAHGRVEDEQRASAAGFRKYLRKPVDMQELAEAVAGAVG
ncbi:MAG TPA: ATP-binding protein [Thermoanaerobaculia bacterium]